MRLPFTNVPLLLFKSTMMNLPSRSTIRKWRRDTRGSASATSLPCTRPMVISFCSNAVVNECPSLRVTRMANISGEAEQLSRFVDGGGLATHVARQARGALHELAVALRHLAVRQVEVVLEPAADVAAEHER